VTAPTRAETGVLAAVAYVAWLACGSLLLAVTGHHSTPAAAALAVTGATLAITAALRAGRGTTPDRTGALLVLGAAVAGAVMFAPAFPYGSSDRDPGVYAYDAYAIARTGTVHVPDPLADLPAGSTLRPILDGQRVPGMHPERGGTALAGFFATEPALAATAYDLGGGGALRLLGPLLGALALAAFGLAVRRAAGTLAGALTIALLAGDMLDVWQAKTPGPEVLAQAFVAAALLAAVLATSLTGRARTAAAALAGALTTAVWVARPDGVLAVGLGAALAALAYATRRRGVAAYLAGLALPLPLAAWQAYGLAAAYVARNGVPRPATLLGGAAGLVIVAALARAAPAPDEGYVARVAHHVAAVAAVTFAGYLLLRQAAAPPPQPLQPGSAPLGWAPYTLWRIAKFFTWPGIVLALGGVVALTRPPATARRWLLLAPALLGATYLVDPRNSPDLMFWGRRFVPTLVPGLAILAAAGIAALWQRPVARRALGVALAVVAVAVPYAQSLPLRTHREYGGTLAAATAAADASRGQQAVYLWVRPGAGCCESPAYLFAGAVWLRYGKASMTVSPAEAEAQAAAAAALPQRWPVLVVGEGAVPPFAGPLTAVGHHVAVVPVWDRGGMRPPLRARQVRVEFTVWRYDPPATA
jgi:hypothetical protein